MTIKEIKNLRETEDKEVKEIKRNFNFAGSSLADPVEKRKYVLGYVVAEANEGGGLLVFGITDKHPHVVARTTFATGKTGEMENQIYEWFDIRVKIEKFFENEKRVFNFNLP